MKAINAFVVGSLAAAFCIWFSYYLMERSSSSPITTAYYLMQGCGWTDRENVSLTKDVSRQLGGVSLYYGETLSPGVARVKKDASIYTASWPAQRRIGVCEEDRERTGFTLMGTANLESKTRKFTVHMDGNTYRAHLGPR